jgi:hypothetical protein
MDLLHAANLRHGTHGFTSLPKEGMLRIFSDMLREAGGFNFEVLSWLQFIVGFIFAEHNMLFQTILGSCLKIP